MDIPIIGKKPLGAGGPPQPNSPQAIVAMIISEMNRMRAQIHALHNRVSELEKERDAVQKSQADITPVEVS